MNEINPDCQGTHVLPDQISALTKELEGQKSLSDKLAGALKTISTTNGLQYSHIFRICDDALKEWEAAK